MNIITQNQDLPILLTAYLQSKRAIQAIPLLATLGITAAMVTGAAGIGIFVHYYTKLSNQLISDLQMVAESILTLQKQLDSLASVYSKTDEALTCSLQRRKVSSCFYKKNAASMLTSQG
jgi:hypothetical protein